MTERLTPLRIAPLQRITAQPVTDPGQLAAMDEMRARQREETDSLGSLGAPNLPEERARVLELCLAEHERLADVDRPAFMAQFIGWLSAGQRLELLEWLITALSQDAFEQLKTQLSVKPGPDPSDYR